MGFDFREFKKFSVSMKRTEKEFDTFLKKFLLTEALRIWVQTKENTPVDTGLMRNMWQIGDGKNVVKYSAGSEQKYSQDSKRSKSATIKSVKKQGNDLVIEIYNPVEYASYVEDGHEQEPGRYVPAIGKRLKRSWVQGKGMARIAIKDAERKMPERFKKAFETWLKGLEVV